MEALWRGTTILLAASACAYLFAGPGAAVSAQSDAEGPVSFVCPMRGDEEVLEDAPGACPKCNMRLVPVRLVSKYACPIHSTQDVRDQPGQCRFDGRELVPITLSVFWTCAGDETRLLEPGACSDGAPRRVGYEVRAHGDHNPRHGGQFFMAEDAWHHLEGTFPGGNVFRLFFYDNYTKPLAAKGFSARVVTKEEWDPVARVSRELEAFPLRPGRDFSTLEAVIKDVSLPLKVSARIKFDPKSREQRFDFSFLEYSQESPSLSPATTAAAQPEPPTASVVAPPKGTVPPRPSTSPTIGDSATLAPRRGAPPATISQAPIVEQSVQQTVVITPPMPLPPELDESALPHSTAELLDELSRRAGEVQRHVDNGSLAEVWLPAVGTKTVALALQAHASTLPGPSRVAAESAIRQIIIAAWTLDEYGDLGNGQKVGAAYNRLAAAVADLKAAYGTR